MASAIKLPDMGTNVEECKVLSWRVREGDTVKRGDILADIETDKAVAELESTAEGVVLRLIVEAGDITRTGDILAYVGKPDESVPGEMKPAKALEGALSPQAAASVTPSAHVGGTGAARVSPVVRNLAAKLGVDLGRIQGTGAGGMITREDVMRARRD